MPEKRESKCTSCGAAIVFAKSSKGAWLPLDTKPKPAFTIKDGNAIVVYVHTPHWATCPSADQHRKGSKQ